ncbi:hypothetical protein NDA11_001028 [Ustilago hordei]|uniref:CUE domain-containing protein n=1 Tax=Ustilago hordei TaxID=120017 RepID=I2G538_USTHO|nr:uncharacterized protein UHO2_01450 [Ustilago hordei]KAJ1583698.1 hypothetical protein NDA15_006008 [Ustilago hordei]KAJ1586486.1 hypothetical protein NDA11_001028 [Ustilago hordei]KAJ1591538.1 hypothetical protein NDA12_000660 [Ustilago hordei]KAJ1603136.1 hypothetical protein NDA14_003905 [Ustilago hordei]UTT94625.1 hypothetical protein NDA17_002231 [Ustilago hordei]
MSEPVQKGEVDLKSLDQALDDLEAASEVPAETLKANSDTLAQPPVQTRSSVGEPASKPEHAKKASSPATLSPSSPRVMSPASAATRPTATATQVPPAVAELKSMFPDLDNETIAAVLSSRGGDQESAVNALLQMSDPNFKPATPETRTDSDALLAQTIAMEEEQRHHEQMAQHQQRLQQQQQQQQQQHSQSMGRGGGGAGSFFSGLLNPDSREQSAPSAPSYDPNALTYQPRVRKGPTPASGAAGARNSYASQNQQPAASPSYADGESIIPGMPGAKEAKQWQEEINRMAETGLARAASTFSTFRQKASAAFNNAQEGGENNGQAAVGASGGNATGAGFAQAFQNFKNTTGRSSNDEKATASTDAPSRHALTSPRTPNASEYDQDPSPVSENELAKIISRGRGGRARALADRYGLGIKNTGRANSASTQGGAGAESSDYAGWDQAGRAPISIKDNTNSKRFADDADKKRLDSIARMDSAGGRGITSPRIDRSPTKETSTTTGTGGVAAAGTAGAAGGVGAASLAKDSGDDPNDDSDDLEYVSNPFEDED